MDIESTCECKCHVETIAALKNVIDGQSKMIAEQNMTIEMFVVKVHMNHSVRYTAHDADYFDAQKERVAYVLRKSPITERTVDNGKNGQRW